MYVCARLTLGAYLTNNRVLEKYCQQLQFFFCFFQTSSMALMAYACATNSAIIGFYESKHGIIDCPSFYR